MMEPGTDISRLEDSVIGGLVISCPSIMLVLLLISKSYKERIQACSGMHLWQEWRRLLAFVYRKKY